MISEILVVAAIIASYIVGRYRSKTPPPPKPEVKHHYETTYVPDNGERVTVWEVWEPGRKEVNYLGKPTRVPAQCYLRCRSMAEAQDEIGRDESHYIKRRDGYLLPDGTIVDHAPFEILIKNEK